MAHKLDSSVALSFTQGMDTVTMYLPPNMEACAAMIVGAFNAHRGGETVADGVVRMTVDGAKIARRQYAEKVSDMLDPPDDDIIGQRIEGFGVS